MRLTFGTMREVHARLVKASELRLPEDERRGACVAGEDPVEPRPAPRRMSFTSKPSMPGIKGGCDRSGAEVEASAGLLLFLVGLPVVILAGYGCAQVIAAIATAAGRALA